MTAVFITVYRQRTQPKINEERSVQGQINQIILQPFGDKYCINKYTCLLCYILFLYSLYSCSTQRRFAISGGDNGHDMFNFVNL